MGSGRIAGLCRDKDEGHTIMAGAAAGTVVWCESFVSNDGYGGGVHAGSIKARVSALLSAMMLDTASEQTLVGTIMPLGAFCFISRSSTA